MPVGWAAFVGSIALDPDSADTNRTTEGVGKDYG
jgi:hypothetical protein